MRASALPCQASKLRKPPSALLDVVLISCGLFHLTSSPLANDSFPPRRPLCVLSCARLCLSDPPPECNQGQRWPTVGPTLQITIPGFLLKSPGRRGPRGRRRRAGPSRRDLRALRPRGPRATSAADAPATCVKRAGDLLP